jgi:hypothetical protein
MLWRRGKPYSQDFRERVFAVANDGETVSRIAAMLRVCFKGSVAPQADRAKDGAASTLPRGSQTERSVAILAQVTSPSRCDDRGIARLAA